MAERAEHYYDAVGVCIYCGQCDDSSCCDAMYECPRTVVEQLGKSAEAILAEFRAAV